jgi:hypothetical protein
MEHKMNSNDEQGSGWSNDDTREEFSVIEVFKKSAALLLDNLVPFTATVAIVFSPYLFYMLVATLTFDGIVAEGQYKWTFNYIPNLLTMILGPLAAAAVTFGVTARLRGEPISISESLNGGLSRIGAYIGVALVTGLAIGLGLLLLVIPGLIVMCVLAVAAPAAVVEERSISEALSRSVALTKDLRFPIFGLMILLGLLGIVVDWILRAILGADDSLSGFKLYLMLNLPVTVALKTLAAIASVVLFYDLRKEKEGTPAG